MPGQNGGFQMFGDDTQTPSGLPATGIAAMPADALKRYRAFMSRDALATGKDWMQVDAYKARIERLDASMVGRLHELTVGVLWPHRAPDLQMLLQLGHGYVALDEIGRPMGSAMCFHYGDDFAMCGMMVTPPRLQAQGTGRRLLRRLIADCPGRDLRLSATRVGYRLYESAGFVPVGLIHQHQGIARPVPRLTPVPGLTIRPASPGDIDAIRDLDLAAYGAPRRALLDMLLDQSQIVVAERGSAVIGFAMIRSFGKGKVIGPLVAEDDVTATHLAAALIGPRTGQFLRLDTPIASDAFADFLIEAGLVVQDTVTEMRLGRMRRAVTGPLTYGMATQSLG